MKSKSARMFAGFVGVVLALGMAVPAGAQTTAELTAMINSLLAQIAVLQAQIGGSTGGASMTFTSDLTIGSTGSEVSALQQWLVGKGYLVMPAGVSMGYFGNLTKSALAKYQAEAGISPAAGYFGPITRAKVNAMASTGGTGGTTGGTTGGSTGITTPGVEGTLSATESSSGIPSTVYEGDEMVGVLGIKLEAKNSDIAVQRIKLDMDCGGTCSGDTKFYNKVFKKLYVTDGSNVLASTDLNSSTVVKDGSDYFITIAGFNLVIPKNSDKTIVIKADLYSAIDSADYDAETYTIALASNGVRGVDGAGIDQYAGSSSIASTPTISADLTDSATLQLSLNTSTPKLQDLICAGGSNENECDKLTVLVFDVKAEKDDVTITDLQIAVDKKVGTGTAVASSTVYIFDGSTEVDSTSVTVAALAASGDTAIFNDFDQTIPKNTTKTYTVKMDVRSANLARAAFEVSASSTGITDENSRGDGVSTSGTATGYRIGVRNAGPEFTLVSKSISTDGVAQTGGSPVSTSTLTAVFNVKVKAVGSSVEFGTVSSGTPTFASSTVGFKVYRNGAYDATVSSNATSTSFAIPSICTTSGVGSNSCSLAEGTEMTIPVTFQIYGRTATGAVVPNGLYAVGIEGIQWTAPGATTAQSTTFMAGEIDWRTADVSFP